MKLSILVHKIALCNTVKTDAELVKLARIVKDMWLNDINNVTRPLSKKWNHRGMIPMEDRVIPHGEVLSSQQRERVFVVAYVSLREKYENILGYFGA